MNQQYLNAAETKMKAALEHLEGDLAGLRSGRANAGLVDSIKVEVYGQSMPIKGLATITTPDAKTIQIQPWDQANLSAIDKAIREHQALGLNPSSDGHTLRLNIPPMSEETRSQMVKLLGQKAEEANVSMRNGRHEVLNEAKSDSKAKKITEDDLIRVEKDLNSLIERYQGKVSEAVEVKEKELMAI
ncbi:ribosome recycling factor [Candidatus Saccharibacteria bacterium]|nr:ribosome recycling factor [Candidatus Saccharibacteria bacterium]